MIELIAAAHTSSTRRSALPNNSKSIPHDASERVPMDTGVGLFQVFEIATAPQVADLEEELAHDSLPHAGADSVTATEATPPSEQSAAVVDGAEAEPIRAASLPALLAVAAGLFNRRSRRRGEQLQKLR